MSKIPVGGGRRAETRRQDRNGVKVRVHVFRDDAGITGTSVEASCQCFGLPGRLHSDPDCDERRARWAERQRKRTGGEG